MSRFGLLPDYALEVDADGSISQKHAKTDWLFGESQIAAARPVTGAIEGSSIDWLDRVGTDKIQDQLGGTCVGQALGSSAFMRARIAGRPIRRPSATLIVAFAQMTDSPGSPIDCDGCYPTVAIRGARDRGLVADEEWPETHENLVTIPPEDVWARAEGATVEAYYRIPDGGDVVAGLRSALERGYLPIFGMSVDTKYENTGSAVYDEPGGGILGNHAQLVVGYSTILNAFRVMNSWGVTFGEGGLAWVSAQFMARRTFDRLVAQTTPKEI